MQLSQHFSLLEATTSQTAARRRINNDPPPHILDNMILAADKMEKVRIICGNRPIFVSSWYRSPTLNGLVGGSATSAHMKGYAVDFTVAGLSIKETIRLIEADILPFDQLINEFNRWVHISFSPRNRGQVFSIGA